MSPHETMHRIREMRKKYAHRWAAAVLAGVVVMVIALWDLEAESAVLAPCPTNWQMTCSGTCTSTCDSGAVTRFEYYGPNRGWWVRVEPGAEILKEGFE